MLFLLVVHNGWDMEMSFRFFICKVVSILLLGPHLLMLQVTRDRYIKIKSSSGEAGIVAFDIMATNGVVHIVNSVF